MCVCRFYQSRGREKKINFLSVFPGVTKRMDATRRDKSDASKAKQSRQYVSLEREHADKVKSE